MTVHCLTVGGSVPTLGRLALALGLVGLGLAPAHARILRAAERPLETGASWESRESASPGALPPGWERATLWDLRALVEDGTRVVWEVRAPAAYGLAAAARGLGAEQALCAHHAGSGRSLGCRLLDPAETGLAAGDRRVRGDGAVRREVAAIAEGIVLVPAGPRECVLLRIAEQGADTTRLLYRFVSATGVVVAEIEGSLPAAGASFTPTRASVLVGESVAADNGFEIPFLGFRTRLRPGATGFLQYSAEAEQPLSSVHPAWDTVASMISIDQTNVPYQPDPGDSGSQQTLPEVWDFAGLTTANLGYRTFNHTRDDAAGATCITNCAARDVGPSPPDGTWQGYLKIDIYAPGGALYTQDYFGLNDNDTGANPSIDVPYVQQDELNTDDRTQVCFQLSAGGANRLLRFFRFTGADPASATMGVGDTWTSGAWTECDDANGLRLAAASLCGDQCWPGCSAIASPRARGRLTAGAGFRMTALEDGWVHMPTGNYVPALLLRQDTDLLAGVDFITACSLSPTPQRSFDYFWVNTHYGLLASVSSPTSETIAPGDWSAAGNATDGVDFSWGPFPPHQITAQACLAGTRVGWALPADGSNIGNAPNVAAYGYVVSWGDLADPEQLADWTTNPNHSPLPGDAGYLAAPAGSEPTSFVISGWGQPAVNATVVTALRYTDPDVLDAHTFRSAAFYKVTESPARLDAQVFQVGNGVAPFTSKTGSDIGLTWPAVPGAASYLVRVWDLNTRAEIPCPAGLNCTPTLPQTTHVGAAATAQSYGYRVFAVDPCGAPSAN